MKNCIKLNILVILIGLSVCLSIYWYKLGEGGKYVTNNIIDKDLNISEVRSLSKSMMYNFNLTREYYSRTEIRSIRNRGTFPFYIDTPQDTIFTPIITK